LETPGCVLQTVPILSDGHDQFGKTISMNVAMEGIAETQPKLPRPQVRHVLAVSLHFIGLPIQWCDNYILPHVFLRRPFLELSSCFTDLVQNWVEERFWWMNRCGMFLVNTCQLFTSIQLLGCVPTIDPKLSWSPRKSHIFLVEFSVSGDRRRLLWDGPVCFAVAFGRRGVCTWGPGNNCVDINTHLYIYNVNMVLIPPQKTYTLFGGVQTANWHII
jgi:hypothetical protein